MHADLQLGQLDALVIERLLRREPAAFEIGVGRVIGIVDAARATLTQYRIDPVRRLLFLQQNVLHREGAVEFAVQRDERNRQRETRLFRVDPRGVARR